MEEESADACAGPYTSLTHGLGAGAGTSASG